MNTITRLLGIIALTVLVATAGFAAETTTPTSTATNDAGNTVHTFTGELAQGDFVLQQDNSLYDVIVVDADAGQTLIITMTSEAFDTYLLVLDRNDNLLGQNDDAEGMGLNSQYTYTATASGHIQIIANSFTAGMTGPYQVTAEVVPASE